MLKKAVASGKILVLFSKVLEILAAFVLIKFISDLLAPSEFAALQVFLAITQGVAWLFISPLQNYILVNCVEGHDKGWYSQGVVTFFLYSLGIGILSYLVLNFFSKNLGIELLIGNIIMFALSVAIPINLQVVHPSLNIFNQRLSFSIISMVGSVLSVMSPVVLVNVYGGEFLVWQAGVLISQLALYLFSVLKLNAAGFVNRLGMREGCSIEYSKVFSFSLPLSLAVGFQWYVSQGYRIQIGKYIEANELGLFLMGFTFGARFFNSIEKIFSAVFLPELYNRGENKIYESWKIYFLRMLLLFVCTLIVLVFVGEWLYESIVSESFAGGAKYILAGLLFDFVRCNVNSLFQLNLVCGKNGIQLVSNLIMSLCLFIVISNALTNGLALMDIRYSFALIAAFVFSLAFYINKRYINENS